MAKISLSKNLKDEYKKLYMTCEIRAERFSIVERTCMN